MAMINSKPDERFIPIGRCFLSVIIYLVGTLLSLFVLGFNIYLFSFLFCCVCILSFIYFGSSYGIKFNILYFAFASLFVVAFCILMYLDSRKSLGTCIVNMERDDVKNMMILHDINSPLDESGNTLLHYVALEKDTDLYNRFFEKGADENIKNKDGVTPRYIKWGPDVEVSK